MTSELWKTRLGLFFVTRTSQWDSEKPPCEGATFCETILVDRRTVDDPKKIPINNGTDGDWYTQGTNHRIEEGCICRDMGVNRVWYIEVPDLPGLIEFIHQQQQDKRVTGCILSITPNGYNQIEIYDDYRE